MNKRVRISLLILLSFVFTSCGTYYRSSDLKKYFNTGAGQASKAVAEAEKDYMLKKGIINEILGNITEKKMAPYPEFQAVLSEMDKALAAMKAQGELIGASKNRAEGIIGTKKRIESNKPEYGRVVSEKKTYEDLFKGMKGRAESYQKKSAAFNSLAARYSIVKVNSQDVEKKVNDYRLNADAAIAKTNEGLLKAGNELNAADAKGYNPKVIAEKRRLLEQMKLIMPDLTGKKDEVLVLAEAFRKEAKGRGEFYSGPGMATHALIEAIKVKSAEVKELTSTFNSLAARFGR